jgi:hypothetical protein
MRAPGEILLISCYELGHQPFALALPLGFIEQAGYAPAAMDIAVEPFDEARVARARFVGISVPMHTALRLGVRVAERVRALNPTCHLCFYGLYASLNADYLLAHGADSVIGGEVEGRLVALVERLERGGAIDIPGVARRGRPAAPVLERLAFAAPSRAALPPLDRYARLERGDGRRDVAGYVEASRGCLHTCLHCPIPPVYGGRFFVLPRDTVLADVRRQVEAGARHITFGDPDFLNGPTHAMRLARALHAEFPQVTFDITAKIEHILKHAGLFPELAAAGCAFVVSAAESLNDVVLANLEKGHTAADVSRALRIVREAGTVLRPTFVPFTPWETLDSYVRLFDVIEREGLIDHVDPVQYSIRLLVPPGSALLERPAIQPFLRGLDEAVFTYRWAHPDPRMDDLHRAVGAAVEAAAQVGEDPALTFYRLRALARAAQGTGVPAVVGAGAWPLPSPDRPLLSPDQPLPSPDRPRPPRLSEPWFC